MTRHINRKRFLRTTGLACGGGLAWSTGLLTGCASDPDPAASDAPARRLAPPLERIGLQLYTVRSLMAEDVAATLDAVAAIGYQEVEFAGYFGHAPAQVRALLDAAGLTAPAAHMDLIALQGADLAASIEAALVVGHRWLVVPWIAEELRTADGYREVAAILNEAGAAAQSAGLRVAYHNHAFEFETVVNDPPGTTGYAVLAEALDPSLVDLEIDLHWSAVAGVDALALFAEYPGRFTLCHLKDLTSDGRMADVGAGQIDWDALLARSEQAGLQHYFVEHDQPDDPIASVEASYRYLSAT